MIDPVKLYMRIYTITMTTLFVGVGLGILGIIAGVVYRLITNK